MLWTKKILQHSERFSMFNEQIPCFVGKINFVELPLTYCSIGIFKTLHFILKIPYFISSKVDIFQFGGLKVFSKFWVSLCEFKQVLCFLQDICTNYGKDNILTRVRGILPSIPPWTFLLQKEKLWSSLIILEKFSGY